MPRLPDCPHGDQREWHGRGRAQNDLGYLIAIPHAHGHTGTNYQNTLYCRRWRKFINPNGFTCSLCIDRRWPLAAELRAHVLPPLLPNKRTHAEDMIVRLVAMGRITEEEARDLAHEFRLT